MIVKVNIQGAGFVDGAGDYMQGASCSLAATPAASMRFKGFLHNGSYHSSPYSFTVESDTTIDAVFYLPIESYLKNIVGFHVTDENIIAVLSKRGISYGADVLNVSQKLKDLAYADILMTIATTPDIGSAKEQMGNWSSQSAGRSLSARGEITKIANSIYVKYGERVSMSVVSDVTNKW